MRGVDYTRGAYTWSNTCEGKCELTCGGAYTREAYRQRNMVFLCCYGTKASKGMTFNR